MPATIIRQRNRGSLVDAVTLETVLFQYEPKVKTKETPTFAKQKVVGRRLPITTYVGSADSAVELDITLSPGGVLTTDELIAKLQSFAQPQTDTGAPHPLYLNVGETYIGKLFVLSDIATTYATFDYDVSMATRDAKVKLKLDEIPSGSR